MKVFATVASAALLITLGGCNQLGIGGGNANNSSTSNAAAGNASAGGKDSAGGNRSSNASADASGGKDSGGATQASSSTNLDRTFLMGRWTDNGDCSKAIEFGQDGTFRNADGSGGLWNLEGDRLTLTGSSTATIRVSPVDQDTITVINPDGSLGRSTRC